MINHTLQNDETILGLVSWLINTTKKHGFYLYKYVDNKQEKFKLKNELTDNNEIKPSLLHLVEPDRSKNKGTIWGYITLSKDKELDHWNVEIIPAGYLGLRKIDPFIDDFAHDWLKTTFKKNMKNYLDEKNEYEDSFEVENKTIEDFNKWILYQKENLKIFVINRKDDKNIAIWDVYFNEREYKLQPDGLFCIEQRGQNILLRYDFYDIDNEIDFSQIINQIKNDWIPIEVYEIKPFLPSPENINNGRPKHSEDVKAWEKINIYNEPKEQVYNWWIALPGVKKRELVDPKRHFLRISKHNYIDNL